MKILINKTDKNILPITKIYDLGSVTTTINDLLNESTITLEKNITPILLIDGSNYLINNFNSTNIKEDFEAIITESDLISLGGGSSSGDFIPLTGTEPESPVSGNIEILVSNYITGLYNTDGIIKNTIGFLDEYIPSIRNENVEDNFITDYYFENTGLNLASSNPNFKGIEISQDVSEIDPINKLIYAQRSYVDKAVSDSRPYKVYTALLSQSGTDAPTAVVLENTLGFTPTYNYVSVGEYELISPTNYFTIDKKILYMGQVSNMDDLIIGMERVFDNTIRISSTTVDRISTDELLYGQAFIEIRVYNE